MSSIYPNAIDGNQQIPTTVDNVTPINAKLLNSIKSAILNIEKELGTVPKGSFANVKKRLEYLQNFVDNFEGDLDDITNIINQLESDVNQAQIDIINLQNNVSNLEDRADAFDISLFEIDGYLSDLDSRVSIIEGEYTTNEEIASITLDLNGFENRTDSVLSFDQINRILTIQPTVDEYVIYDRGRKIIIDFPLSITIANTGGGRYISLDPDTLQLLDVGNDINIFERILVAFIYWDVTNQKTIIFGDERHSSNRDTQWHYSQHRDVGAVWRSGGRLTASLFDQANVQIAVSTLISIADEDVEHEINHSLTPAGNYTQPLNFPASIPVLYLNGSSHIELSPTTAPWIPGVARARYNPIVAGVGSLADAPNNTYIVYWLIATNDAISPVKLIMGRIAHAKLEDAANEEFVNYGLPLPELAPMYKITLHVQSAYTNSTPNLRVVIARADILLDRRSTTALLDSGVVGLQGLDPIRGTDYAGLLTIDANADLVIGPNGTGAIQAQVADGTTAGGNARGSNAVDWQTATRTNANQVASGSSAVVGGGQGNTASSGSATVAGGDGNTASNFYATVAGGYENTASGIDSTVGGGQINTASGAQSTVAGGESNTASGSYATVAGGQQGLANLRGMFSHASGQFAAQGDAQYSRMILRRQTTDATPTVLHADGGTGNAETRITIPNNTGYQFFAQVMARDTSGTNSAWWTIRGGIIKDTTVGSTTLIGTNIIETSSTPGAATWIVTATADTTNGALAITVTGALGVTIRWVATIHLNTVRY
jgi:hypothetical protein